MKKIILSPGIFIICSSIVFSDVAAVKISKKQVSLSESVNSDQLKKNWENDSVDKSPNSENNELQKSIKELAHKILTDWKSIPGKEKEFEMLKSNFENLKSLNLSKDTKPKFAQLLVDLYNLLGVISFSVHVTKLIEELNAQDDVRQIFSAIKKLKTTNSNQTYKVLYKAFKNKKTTYR